LLWWSQFNYQALTINLLRWAQACFSGLD